MSEVRLHVGDEATRSATAIGARGYAYANHVVVDRSLGLERANEVLLHELAHTTQVARPSRLLPAFVPMSPPEDDYEREAHSTARAAMLGAPARTALTGPARLRLDQGSTLSTGPVASPTTLEIDEELLIYRWLSRWEIDREPRSLLRNRLGADHSVNVYRIARALWLRRLESRGRVDPRVYMSREEEIPEELAQLRDGPVKALYERAIYIQQQQLTDPEQVEVETQVAAFGLGTSIRGVRLTGDPMADMTALTSDILCSRLSFIINAPIDPLFCIDPRSTETHPLFTAFRATVIAPLYTALRERPGQALVTAMAERRLEAGGPLGVQIRQIAERGVVTVRGTNVVPSLGLLRLLVSFAGTSTARTRGQADFEIASLVRPSAGPHGTPVAGGGFQVGRAVDIVRFAGHPIDITGPADAVAAIAAAMRALPPGCYIFGLPRPPRTDPDGGFEDSQNHTRFYQATNVPPQLPQLSPLGLRAVADNPFLPAVNLRHCPTGNLDGDLALLAPGGRAELTAAAHEARDRGANILCLFPDGPDHLHIQVESCPHRH